MSKHLIFEVRHKFIFREWTDAFWRWTLIFLAFKSEDTGIFDSWFKYIFLNYKSILRLTNINSINALMSNMIHLKRLVLSGIDLDSEEGQLFISPHALRWIEHIELGEWYPNMDQFKLKIIQSIEQNQYQFPKLTRLFLRFEEIHHADEIKHINESIKEQRPHLKVDLKIKGSKY